MTEVISTDTSYSALGFYHKISQLRGDSWDALKRDLDKLNRIADQRLNRNVLKSVEINLTRLEIIEDYHAFPSKEDFRHLWRLFHKKDYPKLAQTVQRTVRALISESYRNRTIDLSEEDPESEELETQDALAHIRRV